MGLVAQDLHAPTAQDVGGANQHGEADGFHRASNVVGRGPRGAARHAEAGTLREGLEALAVARLVNRIAAGPEDANVRTRGRKQGATGLKGEGEVDGGLPAELQQNAVGLFPQQDLSHVLEDERLEVEPVGGVEVRGHRFGIVVDEDRIFPAPRMALTACTQP